MNPRHDRQRGMTLIELTLGLASLSVLGLAIGSLMTAAGNAWDTKDHYVEQAQSMRAVTARVGQWVRQARRIVSTASDSRYADVVIWANDDSDVGNVNLGELKVLTYDNTLGTLTLYQADESASNWMDPATVGSDSFGTSFRSRNDVQAYPLATDLVGFSATVTNGMYAGSMSYRYLHVQIAFQSPSGVGDQSVMVAAAVRAPDQTVDFIGESGDEGGGDDAADSGGAGGGLSVSLGVSVGPVDVGAAADLDPNTAVTSVFVGNGTLGVALAGSSGGSDVAPTNDSSSAGSSSRTSSSSSRSSSSSNSGSSDSASNRRDRDNSSDNSSRNRNNDRGGRDSDADHDRGRGNDGRDNGNRSISRDRGNEVIIDDRGRDSDADHDRGRGNDDHDRGNRSSDRDRDDRGRDRSRDRDDRERGNGR